MTSRSNWATAPAIEKNSRKRRSLVPFRIRFDRLHEVLQAAYGWSNSHLYEFRIRDVGLGIPDGGFEDPIDARKATLLSAIEDIGARSFKYLYDFADGWTHTVKIAKTFPVIADLNDPFLLDAVGRCPPEDVGGPWRYEEFREALANKNHERHDELVAWWGSADYDPAAIDVSAVFAPLDWLYFEACCVCEKVSRTIWRFAWQMMDLLGATKLSSRAAETDVGRML
ncbi:plasmid pRiA4b ORF-3 family protein (plasmid) [Sinorhizobium meliloti]|nr:plasmid pRiA4b ORF-3 family protein [Sinorhizobium meliloti]